MHARSLVLALATALALGSALAAQSPTPTPAPVPENEFIPLQAPRTLGSQTFQIDLGLMVPLFTADTAGNATLGGNLGLGGVGHLKWGAFLNQNLSLGIDVGGALCAGPNSLNNGNVLGLVNVGPHITGNFRLGNIQIPVAFAPAFSVLNYGTDTYLGFSLRPSAGLYFDISPNWSLGLKVEYWWVPEIHAGPEPAANQTRFGNLLEISVSALYSM